MTKLIYLELDVLKPSEPPINELSKSLLACHGVRTVDVSVREMDRKVETIAIKLYGDNMSLTQIRGKIEDFGAVIHSLDRVISGKKLK
ncbi:MAG: DUF211 domain-containing protein [Candidatus Micrarchaeota archaeon]